MTDQASQVTTARSQVDAALAERDSVALQLAECQADKLRRDASWNDQAKALGNALYDTDVAKEQRDALALQLQSAQAALTDALAEHTATVELLREMWEYAGGPHYVSPDGVTLVPGADSTLTAVWDYLHGKGDANAQP